MAEAGKSNVITFQADLPEDSESVFNESEDLNDKDEAVFIQTDIQFCEFYFKVIDKQLARGDYAENVKQALHHFSEFRSTAERWCKFKEKNDLEQLNRLKKSFFHRMMCIYSNATCFSSAVVRYFGNFLNQNLKSLKGLLNKNVLRICSIGGGLPSDVVALVKVLESSVYTEDDVQIHITVVDADKKWKKPCTAILHSMENFSKEKWKIEFIALDPSSQSVSSKLACAIREADFVSIFKFLNQLEDQGIEFKINIFHKLSRLVSPGSVLFVMDDANIEVIQVFQGYLGKLWGHNLLFDAACRLHTLQIPAVRKHHELYSKHLNHAGMCNTSFELFCRAWIRNHEMYLHTGFQLESFDPQIRMAQKCFEEKRARQSQMRLLCRQLGNDKLPEDWRRCFVSEMKNQGCSKKRIQRMLNEAEKDPIARELYAKELMLASYQEFLEDARELRFVRFISDEELKYKKRMDYYRMKRRADFDRQTYENCVQNLLQGLVRNPCTKTIP